MPDFLKKASKRTAAVCAEDESGIAALFVRARVGDETKRLGAPGGKLANLSTFADQSDAEDGDESPASLFNQNAVLVLTDRRLLLFAHGSLTGRVRDLIGEVELSDIVSMRLEVPAEGDKTPAILEITFTDGTTATATPGSRRRQFVAAYERTAQPA